MTRTITNLLIKARNLNKLLKMDTKCNRKLHMCGTQEEMQEVAGRICGKYLHGAWKTVNPAELEVRRLSGGLSNFLYYVALPEDNSKLGGFQRESSPEDPELEPSKASIMIKTTSSFIFEEPKKVLVRIYGQVHGERAMDSIVTETVIFTLLSERRLGPRLHGVFSGGRIEEYIPARSLLTKELADPALSMKIAEKMAAIHNLDVPLSKDPTWLWKNMGKWLKIVREERLADGVKGKNENEERIMATLRTIEWEKEIEWLKKYLATIESPVVFCHNDFQEGNILLLEDQPQATEEYPTNVYVHNEGSKSPSELNFEDNYTSDSVISSDNGEPKLVIIDFEYCSYNHRGFDLANHFEEWAYDYSNPEHPFYSENQENLPTLEQKEIFIKEYLKHCAEGQEASVDEVNHLLHEVEAFSLASHLFWALWSIVNASKSQIPFGYWELAISRLEAYQRLKMEVIKKEKYGIPQKRKIEEVDI